jgi:tartrate dehydratase alpha subunit/fumarate hydratase class I-like protein
MLVAVRQRAAVLGGGCELRTALETITPAELWLVEEVVDREGRRVWPAPPAPVLPPTAAEGGADT